MIQVCPELEETLDKVWSRLQKILFEEGISQICLDEKCCQWLDTAVTLEEELIASDKEDEGSRKEETVGGDVMIRPDGLDGPSFRCSCGCNVFRKTKDGRYKCNSCGGIFIGE